MTPLVEGVDHVYIPVVDGSTPAPVHGELSTSAGWAPCHGSAPAAQSYACR